MTLVHGVAVSHLPAMSPNSFQDRHGQIPSQLVESLSEKPRLMGFILAWSSLFTRPLSTTTVLMVVSRYIDVFHV